MFFCSLIFDRFHQKITPFLSLTLAFSQRSLCWAARPPGPGRAGWNSTGLTTKLSGHCSGSNPSNSGRHPPLRLGIPSESCLYFAEYLRTGEGVGRSRSVLGLLQLKGLVAGRSLVA